jgi:DNA polymerase-3 subunit beta
MQFVINPKTLQKELAFVQGIVERKNTIPVLANILIESADKNPSVLAARTSTSQFAPMPKRNQSEQGSLAFRQKLFDIARLLPDAPVTFRKNEWVTVLCANQNSVFRALPRKLSRSPGHDN